MSESLLEVKNLKKEYRNEDVVTPALNGVSFKIEKGEFVAIMGPSGSGKSTLMHILGFLERPSSGDYFFNGRNVNTFTDDELAETRGKEVGFIFQAFNLLPRTTLLDNIILPLFYTNVHKREWAYRAKKVLTEVGLEHRLTHTPGQISGGEKQRAAIARALINDPAVIFADEPTGNLDSKSGLQVMKILQELNDHGHTIILVTHERYTAEHSKRILKIKDGLIISDEMVGNRQIADGAKELIK
ncbi:MAG: ABC transporter ATP-binding protein [Patescibacteria group bacterium]|nr:ABC transporter ATP-binding protein [Patescibacteria group bacterium]